MTDTYEDTMSPSWLINFVHFPDVLVVIKKRPSNVLFKRLRNKHVMTRPPTLPIKFIRHGLTTRQEGDDRPTWKVRWMKVARVKVETRTHSYTVLFKDWVVTIQSNKTELCIPLFMLILCGRFYLLL